MTVIIDIITDDDSEFVAIETIASFKSEEEPQRIQWDQDINSLPECFNAAIEDLYNKGHRVFIIQSDLDDYLVSHKDELAWTIREIGEVKVVGVKHV